MPDETPPQDRSVAPPASTAATGTTPDTDSGADSDTAPKADADTAPKADADTAPKADANTAADADADAAPDSETDTVAEADTDTGRPAIPAPTESPEDGPSASGRRTFARISIRRPHGKETRPEVPDPLVDLEQRKREAGVEKELPFGRPGQPIGRTHPFMFGFTGALGVFAAWMLIQAITNARQVLILIVVSLFLAIGLNPTVQRLQRTRMSRSWAVAVVFIGVVVVFVGFGFAIVPPLTKEITEFINHIPNYIQQLQQNDQIRELDERYKLLSKLETSVTNANFGQRAIGGLVGVGKVVVSGIFSTLTVLILTLYFLSSLPAIKTFCYRLAPRSRRARVALLGDEILVRIGGYVAGSLTVAMIAGVTAYIFMLVADIPFALPLALIVAVTALIPLVGATFGAALVCIVAFFTGPVTGIVAVIFFVIYQQVENYLIHPRVMKRAVDVHPAVTVIAALIGGTLLGVVGALLAIPTAASLSLIVREVVLPRQELA